MFAPSPDYTRFAYWFLGNEAKWQKKRAPDGAPSASVLLFS